MLCCGYRVNHFLFGLSPRSYHCTNVLLHCLVSVAALHVFQLLLHPARQCAQLASLLFATHPIHTEAVAAVVGRADLLCALFVFCALISYIKAVNEDSATHMRLQSVVSHNNGSSSSQLVVGCRNKPGGENCGGQRWLAMCAVNCSVAMLCKEVGITALGLCSAYELLLTTCGEHGGGLLCFLPFNKHTQYCQRKNYSK